MHPNVYTVYGILQTTFIKNEIKHIRDNKIETLIIVSRPSFVSFCAISFEPTQVVVITLSFVNSTYEGGL